MMFMVALVGVLLVVVVALSYRLWKLRQVGGTAAILRDVPAVGGHGWRHGVIRYRGGEAGFYRLSSLRWWPDRTAEPARPGGRVAAGSPWRRVRHHDRRDRHPGTAATPSPERRRGYEIALDRGALTAFSRGSSRDRRRGRGAERLLMRCGRPAARARRRRGLATRRQDEQQVGEPVQVLRGQHADRISGVSRPRATPTARRGAPRYVPRAAAPTAEYRRAG